MSARKTAGGDIVLERTFKSPVADVWDLWTTKDGVESWWGPDGFRVEVSSLDLRVGGRMHYAMIAVGPDQVAFMKREGMPTATHHVITYTEIQPHRRLAYSHPVDFVPGVQAYDVTTVVELREEQGAVHMRLHVAAMHDKVWTERAVAGWTMELGKLEKVLAR